jgi:hypothetical protein
VFAPNRLLEHRKPADLVREREYQRVLALIDAMAEGVRVNDALDEGLVQRVDARGTTPWSGQCFRYTRAHRDPLSDAFQSANSTL